MPNAALFISFFQGVAILGSALTVLKLLATGLYRRYRIFFAYFLFRVPLMTFFLVLNASGTGSRSTLYFWAFLYCQPVLLVAYVLVVIELYSLALERYRGLYTIGRWVMAGSVLIAGLISVGTLIPKIRPSLPEPSRRLMIQLAAERGVDLALVIFILLIILFLVKFPVPLGGNVIVHTVIYFVFFLSDTIALLWRELLGHQTSEVFNLVATMVSSACSVAWWLLLSAHGEEARTALPEMRPQAEQQILQQLDALNDTLLKISRK
jgi:hypothetical protein